MVVVIFNSGMLHNNTGASISPFHGCCRWPETGRLSLHLWNYKALAVPVLR